MNVKLGDIYKDLVTGFNGVAVSRHEYLNGCIRVAIQPRELHEGKPVDPQLFDIEQIVFVSEGVRPVARETGGPQSTPPARTAPVR